MSLNFPEISNANVNIGKRNNSAFFSFFSLLSDMQLDLWVIVLYSFQDSIENRSAFICHVAANLSVCDLHGPHVESLIYIMISWRVSLGNQFFMNRNDGTDDSWEHLVNVLSWKLLATAFPFKERQRPVLYKNFSWNHRLVIICDGRGLEKEPPHVIDKSIHQTSTPPALKVFCTGSILHCGIDMHKKLSLF